MMWNHKVKLTEVAAPKSWASNVQRKEEPEMEGVKLTSPFPNLPSTHFVDRALDSGLGRLEYGYENFTQIFNLVSWPGAHILTDKRTLSHLS